MTTDAMGPRFGIEAMSVFGLPPVDYVTLAADLGCQGISTGLTAFPYNPHGYAPFSLRDDAVLRREMITAMRDRGVTITLGEGLNVKADTKVAQLAGDLDLFAELGAERINTVSMDPDVSRTLDQFAQLAELAAERGLETTTEFAPALTIADLPSALAAVRHVGRHDFKLLVDTMHLVRSGSQASDLAAIDPALIGYVQVSDAPRVPTIASYFEESMFERRLPGEGELGIAEVLAALPQDRVFSLEVPLRTQAEQGVGPYERLAPGVQALRRMVLGEAG